MAEKGTDQRGIDSASTVQSTDVMACVSSEVPMASETSMEQEIPEGTSENPINGDTCSFFLEGRCRFGERCRNLHPEPASCASPSKPKAEKKKTDASEAKEKKPPMKTAEDVIARIQWDDQLPRDSFTIGYLDRFLGIIEKPFSAFSWEDFASVGYDVLAIPKHRIQYFKFKDLVVWDKTTRTDDVFGSTGGSHTILDIVEKYQQEKLNAEAAVESESETKPITLNNNCEYNGHSEEEADKGGEIHPGGDGIHEQRRPQRVRPSHFIAIRIVSEDVRNAVKEVQNRLVKANPALVEYCTPLPTLHLTLCLLHLDSPEEIQMALTTLQELRSESQRLLPPALILHFQGLNNFHSRVLYLEPSPTPELSRFARALEHGFREKGLTVISAPTKDSLHLTVAKIPISVARKDSSLQLSKDFYGDCPVDNCGSQHVDSLSFCCMGESRRTDGFYTTLMEFALC